MAPPLTEVADIQLQLTTCLSTPKGWKAFVNIFPVEVAVDWNDMILSFDVVIELACMVDL